VRLPQLGRVAGAGDLSDKPVLASRKWKISPKNCGFAGAEDVSTLQVLFRQVWQPHLLHDCLAIDERMDERNWDSVAV
jgi:hypothetical protein